MEKKTIYPIINFQAFLKTVDDEGTVKRVINLYPETFLDFVYRSMLQLGLEDYIFIDSVLKALTSKDHVAKFSSKNHEKNFVLEVYPRYAYKLPATAGEFASLVDQLLMFLEEQHEAKDLRPGPVPDSELPWMKRNVL